MEKRLSKIIFSAEAHFRLNCSTNQIFAIGRYVVKSSFRKRNCISKKLLIGADCGRVLFLSICCTNLPATLEEREENIQRTIAKTSAEKLYVKDAPRSKRQFINNTILKIVDFDRHVSTVSTSQEFSIAEETFGTI